MELLHAGEGNERDRVLEQRAADHVGRRLR
jgi:hypothetical protein